MLVLFNNTLIRHLLILKDDGNCSFETFVLLVVKLSKAETKLTPDLHFDISSHHFTIFPPWKENGNTSEVFSGFVLLCMGSSPL